MQAGLLTAILLVPGPSPGDRSAFLCSCWWFAVGPAASAVFPTRCLVHVNEWGGSGVGARDSISRRLPWGISRGLLVKCGLTRGVSPSLCPPRFSVQPAPGPGVPRTRRVCRAAGPRATRSVRVFRPLVLSRSGGGVQQILGSPWGRPHRGGPSWEGFPTREGDPGPDLQLTASPPLGRSRGDGRLRGGLCRGGPPVPVTPVSCAGLGWALQ